MSYIWMYLRMLHGSVMSEDINPGEFKKFYGKRNLVRRLQRFSATWSYYVKSLKLYASLLRQFPFFPLVITPSAFYLPSSEDDRKFSGSFMHVTFMCRKKGGEKIELRKTPRRRTAKCALNWNHYNFQIITTFSDRGKRNRSLSQPGMKSHGKARKRTCRRMIVVERWQKVRAKIDGRRAKRDISP